MASQQYNSSQQMLAKRGKIITKDNFPVVLNKTISLLYINSIISTISPIELENKLKIILPDIKIDQNSISQKKLSWVPVARNLDQEKVLEVKKLNINGLDFNESEIRFYPEASMAAQLLGFVGDNGDGEQKGYFGLEGYYDKELKGENGSYFFEQDAFGHPIPLAKENKEESIPGRNLILNIDRQLQFLSENRLKAALEKYSAISGTVIIMNPKNGAVLTMASFPNYDPSAFNQFSEEYYRNPVISSGFEPGSIFKIIMMASAIDAKAVGIDEKCSFCYGPKIIADYSIKTWNDKYYPSSTMTDIIVHSDNVGMVYVAQKLGKNKFYDYLNKFGFGEKTGIDLQGEASPILQNKKDFGELDLATSAFGQGIAVTPIQILSAVSAIANKGELFRPQVVYKIVENNKTIIQTPIKKGNPISEKTAKTITDMMVSAVADGESKWAKPKGYKIAGKTGTAQIPIAGHYDPEKTIASFIGFAPADDPAFVMLVTLNEPKSSQWGSETAAPLWFEIAEDIFKIWNIKPEGSI